MTSLTSASQDYRKEVVRRTSSSRKTTELGGTGITEEDIES